MYAEAQKCRYCDPRINTSTKLNNERLLSDTFVTIDMKKVILKDLISDRNSTVLNILRLGDRPEWVRKSVDLCQMLADSCPSAHVIFLFLDTDSSHAKVIFSQAKRQIRANSFLFLFTDKYVEDLNSPKFTRWNIEITPVVCVFKKGEAKTVYAALIPNDRNAWSKILEFVECR